MDQKEKEQETPCSKKIARKHTHLGESQAQHATQAVADLGHRSQPAALAGALKLGAHVGVVQRTCCVGLWATGQAVEVLRKAQGEKQATQVFHMLCSTSPGGGKRGKAGGNGIPHKTVEVLRKLDGRSVEANTQEEKQAAGLNRTGIEVVGSSLGCVGVPAADTNATNLKNPASTSLHVHISNIPKLHQESQILRLPRFRKIQVGALNPV
eukprot:1136348-Pelagomonas_calceolata.AAC.3